MVTTSSDDVVENEDGDEGEREELTQFKFKSNVSSSAGITSKDFETGDVLQDHSG